MSGKHNGDLAPPSERMKLKQNNFMLDDEADGAASMSHGTEVNTSKSTVATVTARKPANNLARRKSG